jgi:hypothetical protein
MCGWGQPTYAMAGWGGVLMPASRQQSVGFGPETGRWELAAASCFSVLYRYTARVPHLIAYTRDPIAAGPTDSAHSDHLAWSMHLAIVNSDGSLEILNQDQGVLLAAAVAAQVPGGYPVRALRDPRLLPTADGYTVVAVPALADGSPDPKAANCKLVFHTTDLINYQTIGLLDLGAASGVHLPRICAAGQADLPALGSGRQPTSMLEIDDLAADALRHRFGRSVRSGTTAGKQTPDSGL